MSPKEMQLINQIKTIKIAIWTRKKMCHHKHDILWQNIILKCYLYLYLKAVNTLLYYHVTSVMMMFEWKATG